MWRRKVQLELLTYASAVLLCALILISITHLWDADFSIPLSYVSDGLFYNALFKGIVENGWVFHNDFVGAPTGLDLYDLSMSDNLHFCLAKLISYVAPDYALTINVFSFLAFPLTTLTTLFVLRSLRLSRASSVVASLLYAFLPYHFIRLGGHTLLAAYYGVPLAVLILLWAFSGEPIFFRYDQNSKRVRLRFLHSKGLITVLICLVTASSGTYYAFFACFFLTITVLCHILTRQKLHVVLTAAILIGLISGGVLINLLPNLHYNFKMRSNTRIASRTPAESEYFGLKITDLLFPSFYHRVSALRKLELRYALNTPLGAEGCSPALGLIGSLGFLILLTRLFRLNIHYDDTPPDTISRLSTLNLSAILLGTVGGFSSLFANLVSPQIRAYNRVSIYIAFFAITAFFLSYEACFTRIRETKASRLSFYGVLVLILAIGVLDQTPSSRWIQEQGAASYFGVTNRRLWESYKKDAEFIHRIEAAVPEKAMIFQLPYIPFPEWGGVSRMIDYDHFRAYLHSKSLRWSYGVIKGRMTDAWQRSVAAKPIEELVTWVSLSGFSGIYIDRYGYTDMGADLEGQLSTFLAAQPLISSDKRHVFFDLGVFNKNTQEERERRLSSTLLAVWGEGFSDLEQNPDINWRWCGSEGKLYIYNISNKPKQATLEMTLATAYDKLSNLRIESPFYVGGFKLNRSSQSFSHKITVPPGTLVINFMSDATRVIPPKDFRVMVFRVINFRLMEF